MKKFLSLFLMVGVLVQFVQPARAAKVDDYLRDVWARGVSEKNLHLLDNGTIAYFYDINRGEKMMGVASSFFSFRHVVADWGVIKTVETSKTGFPLLGLNYKIGAHLAGYEWVKRLTRPVKKFSPLLKMASVGGWAGRDFNEGIYRYGIYGGLRREFSDEQITDAVEKILKKLNIK